MNDVTVPNFNPPAVLETPVLFLVFNRMEETKKVFESIKVAKPPRLYLASDGPRYENSEEEKKVLDIRNYLIKNIDWDCEVYTKFREKNLGCKYAVSDAITWFFEHEEQGIILEDDCLPSQSFFWFCDALLKKYKENKKIWHISGDNFQDGFMRGESSYYFSKHNHIWGWATWRDRWGKYDLLLSNYSIDKKNMSISPFWKKIFKMVYLGKINTWDHQWVFTMWKYGGLAILPSVNLITNIGFGETATHTKNPESFLANMASYELYFPLSHPKDIVLNVDADTYSDQKLFTFDSWFIRLSKKILSFFN